MKNDEPEVTGEEARAAVEPDEPEAPPKSPNEVLAGEVARILVAGGLVAEADYGRVEGLLASGNAKPEDWQQLIESALYPRTAPQDDAPTNSQA